MTNTKQNKEAEFSGLWEVDRKNWKNIETEATAKGLHQLLKIETEPLGAKF